MKFTGIASTVFVAAVALVSLGESAVAKPVPIYRPPPQPLLCYRNPAICRFFRRGEL
ncbi:hypothetical protein FRC03_003358 [Tulasnella sp. 419]|nr:hypothetical protein FRC03_003358 [Tulasnella sp. 419]